METAPRVQSPAELAEKFFRWESVITRESLAYNFSCPENQVTVQDVQSVIRFAKFAGEEMVAEALKHKSPDRDPEEYLEAIRLRDLQIHDLVHSSIAWRFRGTPIPGFLSIREHTGNNKTLIEEEIMTELYGPGEFSRKPMFGALLTEKDTADLVAGIEKRFPPESYKGTVYEAMVEAARATDRSSFDGVLKAFMVMSVNRMWPLNAQNIWFDFSRENPRDNTDNTWEQRENEYFQARRSEYWAYAEDLIKNPGKIRDEAYEIYVKLKAGNERAYIEQFLKNITIKR